MGRSYTPKYVVRIIDQSGAMEMCWNCRTNGNPSVIAAEKFRQKMNESVQPGGCNDHLKVFGNGTPHFSKVIIRRNNVRGCVVAVANSPMFEIV